MPLSGIDALLFCATGDEARAARAGQQGLVEIACGRIRATRGLLEGVRCLTLASGLGKKRVLGALRSALQAGPPAMVLNFGTAGALHSAFSPGALTLPREIVGYNWPDLTLQDPVIPCAAEALAVRLPALRTTRAGTCPRIIRDGALRDHIHRLHALDTTDCESYLLARACAALGLPFLALRCVSDRADSESLGDYPACAGAALEAGARMLPALLALALEHPAPGAQ